MNEGGPNMDEVEQYVEEYRTLREEILVHEKSIWQVHSFLLTAAGAIFGYGLTVNNPFVLLVPLVILIPGIYMILSRWSHIYRIAAYIRLLLEPEVDGLNWETHWARVRELDIKVKRGLLWRYNQPICLLLIFHGFQILCTLIASFKLLIPFKWQTPTFILFIIYPLLIVHITHCVLYAKASADSGYHGKFWQKYLDNVEKQQRRTNGGSNSGDQANYERNRY